ncbi:hypothetical protein KAU11_05035 [Candidatus Babeliales bacterium]|nr:hypothetical protein [Candidatus Babeliales bacterium]
MGNKIKNVLSEESAQDQLELFFEYYDMEVEDIHDDQAKALEMSISRIIKSIRKGKLEFAETDSILKITQHLKNGTTIVYGEISGKTKLAMKSKLDTDNYGKIYSLCGSLTGIGEAGISKLKGADLSLCECIGALFLQV